MQKLAIKESREILVFKIKVFCCKYIGRIH